MTQSIYFHPFENHLVFSFRHLDNVTIEGNNFTEGDYFSIKYIVKLKAAQGYKWKHYFHHGKNDFTACIFAQYILYALWKRKDISSWRMSQLLLFYI